MTTQEKVLFTLVLWRHCEKKNNNDRCSYSHWQRYQTKEIPTKLIVRINCNGAKTRRGREEGGVWGGGGGGGDGNDALVLNREIQLPRCVALTLPGLLSFISVVSCQLRSN